MCIDVEDDDELVRLLNTRERWSMRRREDKDDEVDASSLPRRILANT